MNHLAFAQAESASIDTDTRWLSWCGRAEDMLGHALDGDQATDGYSLDGAFAAFREGASVVEYVLDVQGRQP